MTRETKTIELPVTKIKVEVFTFVTGLEKRTLTQMLLKNTSVDVKSQDIKGDIPLDLLYQANDKAVEMLVVSFDGSTEKIIENINNLPASDSEFLYQEINAITQDKDFLAEGKK